jgi:hypothetical protein
MTDLTKAIAELQRISVSKTEHLLAPHDEPFATILNAALSGDLIPRADADLAELAPLRAQVERLTGAAEALGAMPGGYCFCSRNRIGDDSKTHEPECADLRAALTEGAAP